MIRQQILLKSLSLSCNTKNDDIGNRRRFLQFQHLFVHDIHGHDGRDVDKHDIGALQCSDSYAHIRSTVPFDLDNLLHDDCHALCNSGNDAVLSCVPCFHRTHISSWRSQNSSVSTRVRIVDQLIWSMEEAKKKKVVVFRLLDRLLSRKS